MLNSLWEQLWCGVTHSPESSAHGGTGMKDVRKLGFLFSRALGQGLSMRDVPSLSVSERKAVISHVLLSQFLTKTCCITMRLKKRNISREKLLQNRVWSGMCTYSGEAGFRSWGWQGTSNKYSSRPCWWPCEPMAFRARRPQIQAYLFCFVNLSNFFTESLSELIFIQGLIQHRCSKSFRLIKEFWMMPKAPGQRYCSTKDGEPRSHPSPGKPGSPTSRPLLEYSHLECFPHPF